MARKPDGTVFIELWDLPNENTEFLTEGKAPHNLTRQEFVDLATLEMSAFANEIRSGALLASPRIRLVQLQQNDARFVFNVRINGRDFHYSLRFRGLSRRQSKQVARDFAKWMAPDLVKLHQGILETGNPLVIRKTLTLEDGQRAPDMEISTLTQQGIGYAFPDLVKLIGFYRRYQANPGRVAIHHGQDGAPVAVDLYLDSAAFFSDGRYGRAQDEAIKRLEALVEVPLKVVVREEKRRRKIRQLTTGLIQAVERSPGRLRIQVHPYLFLLTAEYGIRYVPSDLKERMRTAGYWKPHHYLSLFWVLQKPRWKDSEGYQNLLTVWGIADDAKQPRRMHERFESCLHRLRQLGYVKSWRLERFPDGEAKKLHFELDPTLAVWAKGEANWLGTMELKDSER